MLAVALSCAFPGAWAQPGATDPSDHDTVARTVIGTRSSHTCIQFAQTGDSTDTAIAACDLALRTEQLLRPDRVAILINRGSMHLHRHEADLALADFQAAIDLDAHNAEGLLDKGAALIQLHQPGPAVAAITQALTLGVREPYKAYYNRGAAREALGDIRGAYEDYTTALQIHPNWAPAEAELARFVRGRQQTLAGMLNGPPGAPTTATTAPQNH
jgi:tetratricopeptide (TPR) repeat protein